MQNGNNTTHVKISEPQHKRTSLKCIMKNESQIRVIYFMCPSGEGPYQKEVGKWLVKPVTSESVWIFIRWIC